MSYDINILEDVVIEDDPSEAKDEDDTTTPALNCDQQDILQINTIKPQ